VAYFTKEATPLHKVTISPRGMSLGHVCIQYCKCALAVFQLDFEIFRTIASFMKKCSGHSLIIKLIFIKFFIEK